MSFSAYIICATPRSGSTLLCSQLTASRIAGRPDSYFAPEYIGEWAEAWGLGGSTASDDEIFNRDYLAAMIRVGTAGTGIFGLRLMWSSIGEAAQRLEAGLGGKGDIVRQIHRAFGPTLFIHLSRQDKAAQAVSLVRAQQTGLWHVSANGVELERTGPPQAPVFDEGAIIAARNTSHMKRWQPIHWRF